MAIETGEANGNVCCEKAISECPVAKKSCCKNSLKVIKPQSLLPL